MGENLDDLILTEPEPESKKQKGMLVILGLVVLLLIIGVILANMIFGEIEDINNTQENPKKEEVVALNTQKTASIKKDELDPDLAPLDENEIEEKKTQPEPRIDEKDDEILNEAPAIPIKAPLKNENEDSFKKPQKKVIKKQEQPKHKIKVTKAPKPKPKPKPIERKKVYSGSVYIQVGSFEKGPNQAFINKIRRTGFRYKIKQYSDGKRRVYVGPFRNRAEANKYLNIVKEKIATGSFIKGNI